MRRRLLALVCVTGSLVSACGMLPGDHQERKTVTVWLMKDSASKEFLRRFTEDFERTHDDLRLDIRIQEWTGIVEKVRGALKEPSGDGPDVIEAGNTQVPLYADGGRLADLTLESMRDWGKDTWLPGLAQPGKDGNKQYGIPWYAANRVVIYRKDLFRQAGIARPPRTRDEWLTATEKLNTGGNQGIYLAGQDWYTLSGFIWDEGGELAEEKDHEWRGTLDSPAALRGMDFYRRLQALGAGPADADEEHPPQAGVFAGGKVAQIIAVPGLVQSIVRQNPDLKDKLGFFPVPGRTAGRPGTVFTGGSDLVVPRNTDDQFAATTVVGALTGAKWDTELARTMNYVPNKTTLAGAVAGAEGVAAMAAGAAHGRATPSTPQWADVEADNPIKEYMTRVLQGGDPAAEARRASRRITEALAPDVG
ncbi:extracellular solute-binding protein [Streptomyces achromogenes]|uniref:extracellular solute-binding protein n=1 Tax=Streptomyces achromogenes TaxID=67255 RepID=UPI003A7FABB7